VAFQQRLPARSLLPAEFVDELLRFCVVAPDGLARSCGLPLVFLGFFLLDGKLLTGQKEIIEVDDRGVVLGTAFERAGSSEFPAPFLQLEKDVLENFGRRARQRLERKSGLQPLLDKGNQRRVARTFGLPC
jgi:hypothetical protein